MTEGRWLSTGGAQIPDLGDGTEPAVRVKSSRSRRPEASLVLCCPELIKRGSVARMSGHGDSGSRGRQGCVTEGSVGRVRSLGVTSSHSGF